MAWKQTASKYHPAEFLAMPDTHTLSVHEDFWLETGMTIYVFPCSVDDKSGDWASQSRVRTFSKALCELQCEVLHYPAGISHLEPWSWRVWQQGLPFLPHTGRHSVSLQQVPNVSCCHIQYLPHDSRSLSMHIDNHCFLWPSTRSSMDMLVSIWLTPKRMEARLITQYHTMPFSVPVDYGSAPCKFLLSVVWCKQ